MGRRVVGQIGGQGVRAKANAKRGELRQQTNASVPVQHLNHLYTTYMCMYTRSALKMKSKYSIETDVYFTAN